MSKRESGITVRLTKEMAEKFKSNAKDNNISQADFLIKLLNQYDDRKLVYEGSTTDTIKEISIFLSYENYFLEDIKKQVIEPKKYVLNCKPIYWPKQDKPFHSAESYKEKLNVEFGIDHDLKGYDFYYWFAVVRDCDKDRFVIVETFYLNKEDESISKLNVNRCKFAKDLLQITQHVKKFALQQEIKNIENILAETITDDEDIEAFLR